MEAERAAAEPEQTLRSGDIIPQSRPRRLVASPVKSSSSAPHLDTIAADLYSVLLSEAQILAAKSRESQGLDPGEQIRLSKTTEAFIKLAKLEMDREKSAREATTQLSTEDLQRELQDTLLLLKDGT